MRYLPHTDADRQTMLATIGIEDVNELFSDVPPQAILTEALDLPWHLGEMAVEELLGAMAARNLATGDAASFLGAGAYRHHVPAAVDHLIQRSEFLTAYPLSARGQSRHFAIPLRISDPSGYADGDGSC